MTTDSEKNFDDWLAAKRAELNAGTDDRSLASVVELAKPILLACGLNPSRITSFTLHVEAGLPPLIQVMHVVPAGVGEAAASVLRRYKLELVEERAMGSLDESVSVGTQVRMTHRHIGSPECDRT